MNLTAQIERSFVRAGAQTGIEPSKEQKRASQTSHMMLVTNLQWNDEFATRAALAWGRLAGQPTDTVEVGGEIEYCEEILSASQLTVIFAVG